MQLDAIGLSSELNILLINLLLIYYGAGRIEIRDGADKVPL
jgi:hypothetical protein